MNCSICCTIVNYHITIAGERINVSSDSLSVILVISLFFLLFKLTFSHRIALTSISKKPVVYSVYFHFIIVACIFFLLEALSLLLPQVSVAVGVWENILLSVQCGMCDNALLVWALQGKITPNVKKAVLWTAFFCFISFGGYLSFLTIVDIRFKECDWCPMFLPTPKIIYFYGFYSIIYLFIIFLCLWTKSHPDYKGFFYIRTTILPWAIFLFSVYMIGNIGILLIAFLNIDAGYCIMNTSVIIYTILYTPILYKVCINDSALIWSLQQTQKVDERIALLKNSHPLLDEIITKKTIHVIDMSDLMMKERIGVGGYAGGLLDYIKYSYVEVFKAEWNGIFVAVKKLFEVKDSDQAVDEFLREATIMGKLRHPNIVQLLGVSLDPENRCLIFEFVEGGSIFDYIHVKRRKLLPSQIFYVALQTARGMLYLHSMNPPILHRDLKSSNLLTDRLLNIKLCDFGLARIRDTKTMTTVGTPQYCAPEVLQGEHYSELADAYSFGILLWELWNHELPFNGMLPAAVVWRVTCSDEYHPKIPSDCPEELAELIGRCFDLEPENRPPFSSTVRTLNRMYNSYLQKEKEEKITVTDSKLIQ